MIYLFDVDGTLTLSRLAMDVEFKHWFKSFMTTHRVMLVTGSDISKTIEQLGEDIVNNVSYSFNSAGNEIYTHGKLLYRSDWTSPENLHIFLNAKLDETKYPKFGNHFEDRPGMLNFSYVGQHATREQRIKYAGWDIISQQRHYLTKEINANWPNLHAVIGGQISIDIFQKGFDKSQILNFLVDQEITFFGDRIDPCGNDYTLAKRIIDDACGQCYNVKNWQHTWSILTSL